MSRLIDVIKSNTTHEAHLTPEDVNRSLVAALRRPPSPHYHVIAPNARPGTVTYCANCGSPVRVPDTWGWR
jgi:hypothetical protein